ncbi:hypothetical protein L484_028041 [Morus notabilis]|uniref:F-box/LRR-repeat protein 15/At3g58940/PEG3-like LRR domain-containing protein n=1 Tax=Morus notabilis TaxID=981085 RepID=W9SWA3_9ROSA|nr:hypothetical protein L484_028041 [Morus notabilis]
MEDISRLSVFIVDDKIYRSNASKRARLRNYLDRFLILRKGTDIQCFHIKWHVQSVITDEEEYRVLSWLHSAAICNVKKLRLHINLRRESDLTLLLNLLYCVFLESLTLNFHVGFGILKIPSSISAIGLSSLKYLKLSYVKINESFGNWVSSNCKFLEELFLFSIRATESLSITSSSLKVLEIFWVLGLEHLHVSAQILE